MKYVWLVLLLCVIGCDSGGDEDIEYLVTGEVDGNSVIAPGFAIVEHEDGALSVARATVSLPWSRVVRRNSLGISYVRASSANGTIDVAIRIGGRLISSATMSGELISIAAIDGIQDDSLTVHYFARTGHREGVLTLTYPDGLQTLVISLAILCGTR